MPEPTSVSVELAEFARELAEGPLYMASLKDASCSAIYLPSRRTPFKFKVANPIPRSI